MSTAPNERTSCPSERAAQEPRRKRGLGAWATGGSLISAILASACCWLPLVAIAFGASAAGAGAFFEQYRPYFLAVAATLLAAGFYFLYIRKEDCEPGSACSTPNPKAQRFSQGMFWVSVLFIGAFAFFPNYVGILLGGTNPGHAISDGRTQVSLSIEGMTCEGCTASITKSLTTVDGVQGVEVDYPSMSARVVLASDALAKDPQPLLDAVNAAGYDATFAETSTTGESLRTFIVEGMTCEACSAAIRAELLEVPGVSTAEVLYEKNQATVQLQQGAETTDAELLAAIEKAGYRATPQPLSTGGGR